MKKTTKLGIWELWNEYVAESVFIDHKPTNEEIRTICELENWPPFSASTGTNVDAFIKKYIHVERVGIYQSKK